MRAALLLAWRNLTSRPGRSALTASVVMLGVALMVAIAISSRSAKIELTALHAGDAGDAAFLIYAPEGQSWLPESMLQEVRATPGVTAALPQVVDSLSLHMQGGTVEVPFVAVRLELETGLRTYRLTAGQAPVDTTGVVLEAGWAAEQGLGIGSQVDLSIHPSKRVSWPVTGLMALEGIGRTNGGGVVLMHLEHYQAARQLEGNFFRALVTVKPGTDAATVQTHLSNKLGDRAQVVFPDAVQSAGSFDLGLSFFGAMAALVAAFLIYGAFSLGLQQQLQEIGMARAVGATSSQVLLGTLLEATGVALVGGLLGLPVGLLLGRGMLYLVSLAMMGRQVAPQPPSFSDLAMALGIGLGMTLVAVLLPAIRSARTSPAVTMRDPYERGESRPGRTAVLGLALAAGSMVAYLWLFRQGQVMVSQLFTTTYYIGAALAVPLLVRWGVNRVLRPACERLGAVPLLAATSLGRNIRRATLTVSATMIALAMLVGFAAVKRSFWAGAVGAIESTMAGDLLVEGDLSPTVAAELEEIDGVDLVAVQGARRLFGDGFYLIAQTLDAAKARQVLPFTLSAGVQEEAWNKLEAGRAIVLSQTWAERQGYSVGDIIFLERFDVRGQQIPGEMVGLEVVGLIVQNFNSGRVAYISTADALAYFGGAVPVLGSVKLSPGADAQTVQAAITERFPRMQVRDFASAKERYRKMVQQEMGVFEGILYLALCMSALGIINTMALSVFEQRREMALLRSVGATDVQSGLMVLVESIFLGLVGVALGLLAGSAFAVSFVQAAAEYMSFTAPFTFPWQDAATASVLVLSLSVLAAIVPAWRASKTPVGAALRLQ